MSDRSWSLIITGAFALIAILIGRQLVGAPMRARRLVLLPAILIVVGFVELVVSKMQVRPLDLACLVVGALTVGGIGFAQGALMRLESRNGLLWGQLPVQGLWLWLLLIASRVLMMMAANGMGAHVAASRSTILVMVGISRLGQAAAVLARATSMGIANAPEKHAGKLLSDLSGRVDGPRTPLAPPREALEPPSGDLLGSHSRVLGWPSPAPHATSYLGDRRHDR